MLIARASLFGTAREPWCLNSVSLALPSLVSERRIGLAAAFLARSRCLYALLCQEGLKPVLARRDRDATLGFKVRVSFLLCPTFNYARTQARFVGITVQLVINSTGDLLHHAISTEQKGQIQLEPKWLCEITH